MGVKTSPTVERITTHQAVTFAGFAGSTLESKTTLSSFSFRPLIPKR